MKMIYKIAKTELRMLFCSPIAWLLLLAFIFHSAAVFCAFCNRVAMATAWENGIFNDASFKFIMSEWMSVSSTLYYYIPLLTMGLISRDLSTGSIKLLYTSPITNKQLVLGKFFSTVVFMVVICLFLAVYVVIAGNLVEHFEWAATWTGLLGIFLLGCTYISIGLFVSSLTSYQFVAALGTFIVLALLGAIGGWGQQYAIVRDITYWFDLDGRVFNFIIGMICSEDFIYFLALPIMFLALTIVRLNSKRQTVSRWKLTGQYLAVVVCMAAVAYVSSRPKCIAYYDATSTKANTLTEASQGVVSKLEGELKITGYVNLMYGRYNDFAYPRFFSKNRETFEQFERFKPDMELGLVYYYDTITAEDRIAQANWLKSDMEKYAYPSLKAKAERVAEIYRTKPNFFVSGDELRAKGIDLTGERTANWLIEWNGKQVWLRSYPGEINHTLPMEKEISAALRALVEKPYKVGVVKAHGSRDLTYLDKEGYWDAIANKDKRNTWINQGFEPEEISLASGATKDMDIVVLGDLRESLTPEEKAELKTFVDRGGNMLILGEPKRRDIMNPLLEELFGVRLLPGSLVQYRMAELRPDVLISVMKQRAEEYTFYWDDLYISMPGVAGIEQVKNQGFTYTPLFCSDTTLVGVAENKQEVRNHGVWNEMESLNIDAGVLVCNPLAGESYGDYSTVATLTREVHGKEQRVVVVGDADCVTEEEMTTNRGGNAAFAIGLAHYLSNNRMPFDVRRPPMPDNQVYLSGIANYWIGKIFKLILPLTIFGLAILIWIRRRSH